LFSDVREHKLNAIGRQDALRLRVIFRPTLTSTLLTLTLTLTLAMILTITKHGGRKTDWSSRLDTIHQRDRRTPGDSKDRANAWRRAVKTSCTRNIPGYGVILKRIRLNK